MSRTQRESSWLGAPQLIGVLRLCLLRLLVLRHGFELAPGGEANKDRGSINDNNESDEQRRCTPDPIMDENDDAHDATMPEKRSRKQQLRRPYHTKRDASVTGEAGR